MSTFRANPRDRLRCGLWRPERRMNLKVLTDDNFRQTRIGAGLTFLEF